MFLEFKFSLIQFLHFILSKNFTFVEPRMGYDICETLLNFMDKYIELNFLWDEWFEKYDDPSSLYAKNYLRHYMKET